jgi:hypothetical protein
VVVGLFLGKRHTVTVFRNQILKDAGKTLEEGLLQHPLWKGELGWGWD